MLISFMQKTLTINTEMIGYLYLEITGEHIDQAINYLREKDIEVRKYA